MAVDYLTSAVAFAEEAGLASNQTASFDSGSTGSNRLLVVAVSYENGDDPNITDITYNGVSLTKQVSQVGSSGSEFQESVELWTLADPATGSNTLALTNSATTYDAAIFALVYTGVDQSTPVGDTATLVRLETNDGTFDITKTSEDDGVAWIVTRDRGSNPAGDFTAATDNTKREQAKLEVDSVGFISCVGDRFSGSGTVTVGATQTGDEHTEDMVAVGVELLASTGVEPIDGSGALAAQASSVTGAGSVSRSGSGDLVAQQAAVVGVAERTITGSGTPQAQSATLAGVAERTITGSSTLAAGGAAVAGVITRSITGSGSLSAQQAALDGSGDVSGAITGSGAFIAQTATLVALGAISREASGALQAGQAEVSGPAERVVTGDGVLTAQQATIDGQAARVADGSGAFAAQQATIDGQATRVATADGALGADAASVTTSATLTRTGSSALQATDAVLSGEGDVDSVVTSGEGVLTAQQATVAGEGTRTVTGTGTTQAQTAQITGESAREITGSGVLQADRATTQGDGGPLVAGAGDFQAQVAQASGEGQVTAAPRTGEGQLVALTANLDAGILRTVKASGAVSADPAETVVHPWIELHTQDSQWTVQKADWGKDL